VVALRPEAERALLAAERDSGRGQRGDRGPLTDTTLLTLTERQRLVLVFAEQQKQQEVQAQTHRLLTDARVRGRTPPGPTPGTDQRPGPEIRIVF
jgi:hypothetical protein